MATTPFAAGNRATEQGRPHVDFHYVIDRRGNIYYTLDLGLRCFHDQGRSWEPTTDVPLDPSGNPDFRYWDDHYAGVLLLGTAKKNKPWPEQQVRSLIALLAALANATELLDRFDIKGRREIPGRADPCPRCLDMDWVRAEVVKTLERGGLKESEDPEWLGEFPTYRDAAISLEVDLRHAQKSLAQRHAFLYATWRHLQNLADATAAEIRSLELVRPD
ncbi:MAG TPA: N-acetylmuramoyl-L-alanine amidase [bacterium]|nr:N-acetylmuramoyl-L-alanine amidase [bacterium]